MKRRICIVTATRAEYGLLKPIIEKLSSEKEFDIQVVVTGAHLSPEFGLTYREIEKDGVIINKKIEMLLSSDTAVAISKSMGLALISFAEYFFEIKPDAVLLLGDRYENLSIASAAMNEGIPIIHLYGGETTEGAIDEVIRHSITKMSYIHMVSTQEYCRRIIQMGENPERVFCVGAMGVENAVHASLMKIENLEKELQIELEHPYAIVTFHPVTLEKDSAGIQIKELLKALEEFPELNFIITKANADKGGRIINQLLEEYALINKNVKVYDSLGAIRYLSVMKYSKMVIGNSSSGLIEAPSFHIPTINIGERQKGRIRGKSVIDCLPENGDIIRAMKRALKKEFIEEIAEAENPYGDGNTSDKIIEILKKELCDKTINLQKKFYDIY